MSQRALAEKCRPELDHTTIRRLELNQGYTQDTLERVARALGVSIQDLFLPPELHGWAELPRRSRQRIAETIQDAAAAYRFRKSG
jgi:transcriptional regulator with XRE-family HTH domain